jgi:golgi-specific brefeldin A-resistance guanine nucleotide exchange factor 1
MQYGYSDFVNDCYVTSNEMSDLNRLQLEEVCLREQRDSSHVIHSEQQILDLKMNGESNTETLRWKRQHSIKVIQSEIRNVISVLKASVSYTSPLRFVEEMTAEEQPLLQYLRELNEDLIIHPLDQELDVLLYLTPFCSAISSRDTATSVISYSLTSLQTLLLHGLIKNPKGMVQIASSLLLCCHEQGISESSNQDVKLKHKTGISMRDDNEEKIIFKILSLSSLVVRQALSAEAPLLDYKHIGGMLDICCELSLRPKESSLLVQCAAYDSTSQIIISIFTYDAYKSRSMRPKIWEQLVALINPNKATDCSLVTSLAFINVALEAMDNIFTEEIEVIKYDLTNHLLSWSMTDDLRLLSLTLRVIFNLFQPLLRNQIIGSLDKLVSAFHFRFLDLSRKDLHPELVEATLTSVLELCLQPSLMLSIYLHYDCDNNRTNLFELIVQNLSNIATPQGPSITILNRLAVEGILIFMDSIAKKCGRMENHISGSLNEADLSDLSETDDESDETDDAHGYDCLGSRWEKEEAQKVSQERKRNRHLGHKVAQEFNGNNSDWIQVGRGLGFFTIEPSPLKVATFLFSTPTIDKSQLGVYLGKGPIDQYPFHAEVRHAFCALFNFKSLSFVKALKLFAGKLRFPSDTESIDRLLEAFAKEIFSQQELNQEGTNLFSSAESAFCLTFSTIMLSISFHLSQYKEENQMGILDFRRCILDLKKDCDFPEYFLTELYHEVKAHRFSVEKDILQGIETMKQSMNGNTPGHWQYFLKKYTEDTHFMTTSESHSFLATLHDRDMFLLASKSVTQSLSAAFVISRDDHLVIKILKGFKRMAKICVYFDLDEQYNEILHVVLGHGRDYIMSCIAFEYAGLDSGRIMAAGPQSSHLDEDEIEGPPQIIVEGISPPMPKNILQKSMNYSAQSSSEAFEGSAAHKGLLALDCGFNLIRTHPSRLREAWPTLIECLCGLRDARALPDRVIFLDDFADSHGNLLPLSPFAHESQKRLDDYYRSLSTKSRRKGWLPNVFRRSQRRHELTTGKRWDASLHGKEVSMFSHALLQVTKRAKLEQVVLMRPKNLPLARQTINALLDAINAYPYFDDPIFEQHAVYSLELALLALISNRDRASDLFEMFFMKFDSVLSSSRKNEVETGKQHDKNFPTPFLMERVVVTILRSCIHLYDKQEVRPQLRSCLNLLVDLPRNFTRYIADRMACGMAIFVSQKFGILDTASEWVFIGDMLDQLAFFGPGRGFIFDGIANIVESQLSHDNQNKEAKAVLCIEGSQVLAKLLLRFIFGTYEKDMSLCIPAMLCLESLYSHITSIGHGKGDNTFEESAASDASVIKVTDQELWKNMAVAYYSVCRQPDPVISCQGMDCFQRLIASTKMSALPDDTWLTLLHLIVLKQPPVTSGEARVNCCSIMAKILLMSIAHLSGDKGNWEDLTDIVNQMVILVGENLNEGRRGLATPLFESTLQSITFVSNHLVSEEFTGDPEYGAWVSDTLLSELEKVGVAGISVKNGIQGR